MMRDKACVVLTSLDMYCIIGSPVYPNSNKAGILIKIIAFSNNLCLENNTYSVKVYAIPNTKEAFENVYYNEIKLGGQLLNSSQVLNFMDNGENLVIRLNEISKGWKLQQTPQTQVKSVFILIIIIYH